MPGILANSITSSMVEGDASADNTVTGYVTGEQITLTVTDVDPASISWGLSIPSNSTVARSGLDDDDVETVHSTPDVGGYYTVTANVDGTVYVLRISVVSVAQTISEGVLGLQPMADAQVPTPAAGENLYFSSTQSGLAVKDSDGNVVALLTTPQDLMDFAVLTEDPAYREGRSYYKDGVVNTMTQFSDVTLQNGRELHLETVNKEGSTIANGSPIYVSGAQGQRLAVKIPDSTDPTTIQVIGLATHERDNNADGLGTTFGLVRGLDTSSWSVGDLLYVNGATLTTTRPTAAGTYAACVGWVVQDHPTDGSIFVNVLVDPVIAGTTANRPALPRVGETWFDTTLNLPIWWNGTEWVATSVQAEYGEMYWSTPALTALAVDTWAKAAGTTTLGSSNEFSMPAPNRLRHDDADTELYQVMCDFSITCAGNNKTVWVGISKNGAEPAVQTQRYRLIGTGADAGMGSTHGLFSLGSGDYVELWMKSADGSDATIERANMSAIKVGQ